MNPQHTVLWDGRRAGPGGAMLYAPESVTVDIAPAGLAYGEATRRIRSRALELGDWHSAHEIAALVGLTRGQIGNPINTLVQTWLDGLEIGTVGGVYAYRTRISECRRQLGMDVRNRVRTLPNGSRRSEYCYIPKVGQADLFAEAS